jgi:hypothetical protein
VLEYCAFDSLRSGSASGTAAGSHTKLVGVERPPPPPVAPPSVVPSQPAATEAASAPMSSAPAPRLEVEPAQGVRFAGASARRSFVESCFMTPPVERRAAARPLRFDDVSV